MSAAFLILNPFQKWKKGDLPCDPTVSIALKQWGTSKDGNIIISASLATDSEIDYAVDQLKKDLELARKNAKRILKSQREKIRSSFRE